MKRILTLTVIAMAVPALASCAAQQRAPVAVDLFRTADFEGAKADAREQDRLLLVYATATWCGPCRHMDQTTWASDRVGRWIDEKAVAYKLDVDEDRDLAGQLEVRAMPTLIAFKGGDEFDRVVGYQSEENLLDWLDGVVAGRRAVDDMRDAVADRDEDGRVDVQARLNLARELARSGEYDEATEEYLWLWDNMLTHLPSMYGVRLSFMIADMKRLADAHEPAREAFAALRDRYRPAIDDGTAGRDEVVDWMRLHEVVGDEDALVAWFDSVKDDRDARELLRAGDRQLFSLLTERGRWADAASLYNNPVRDVQQRLMILDMDHGGAVPEAQREQMLEQMRKHARETAGRLHAVLLAAERDEEAMEVAEVLLERLDDGPSRAALVEAALRAGQSRAVHAHWLDEAAQKGERVSHLRRQLDEHIAVAD